MSNDAPAVNLSEAEAEVDLPEIGDESRYDALMQVMIQSARNAGLEEIYLGVVKRNERAIALYEKLGFVILGEAAQARKPSWRMKLTL